MTDYTKLSDEELAVMTLQQGQEPFTELVYRYQQPIQRYCLRILNFNQQDAEDATSEAFLKAFKNIASFNPTLKFSSWLYRIAHNSAVNLIRDKSKLFFVDIQDFWYIAADKSKDDISITKQDLDKVLNQLSTSDRSLLVLFHLEEKSLKEIGDIFKLTENTVAVKLRRARLRAKKIISSNYV